ncbi:unknown [Erysipelotrichaceae bacterium CAG:64]|nr:unknown [Erysipelotrichaceae bacterium CAG:64]
MSEFQLAPVINFQLPVYGIKKSADAAYDIFSLNTNLKIQCKLMVICGMSVQLYLVKKSVRLKFRQILSGVAVDKGTRALQHLLLQIAAKGILPLVQRAVGEGEGLRL